MFGKKKGILHQLTKNFPVSQAEARRRAHQELIRSARIQVTKSIMLGMTHALSQKHEPIEEPEKQWWKSETARWETIWGMVNQASRDLSNFQLISRLHQIETSVFRLYEDLICTSRGSLHEVPSEVLYEEAVRWREVATLLASLHKHCLLERLHDYQTSKCKNQEGSGITEVEG